MSLNDKQPEPQPNACTPIAELVVADIVERARIGTRKYGTPIQANNGRDALVDAYQEAMDLCCYLRQAIEERKSLDGRIDAYLNKVLPAK